MTRHQRIRLINRLNWFHHACLVRYHKACRNKDSDKARHHAERADWADENLFHEREDLRAFDRREGDYA